MNYMGQDSITATLQEFQRELPPETQFHDIRYSHGDLINERDSIQAERERLKQDLAGERPAIAPAVIIAAAAIGAYIFTQSQ